MLRRNYTGLSSSKTLDLSIVFSFFSLLCGRSLEIFIYERDFFHGRYLEMASFWRGGISLTGVIAGAVIAVLIFCILYKKKFLVIADEIVIPLCLLLILVQIGNHLSGEAYGSVTGLWWGVKFPHAEGFRHPVALYDSLKYLIVFFIFLFIVGKSNPGEGKMTGYFIFLSGLLSFFIDYFHTSRLMFLNAGSGQFFCVLLIILGLLLIARSARKKKNYNDLSIMQFAPVSFSGRTSFLTGTIFLKIVLFIVILIFCCTIPGGITRESLKNPASQQPNQTI